MFPAERTAINLILDTCINGETLNFRNAALFIYYKSEYENKGEIERKNKGDFDDLTS